MDALRFFERPAPLDARVGLNVIDIRRGRPPLSAAPEISPEPDATGFRISARDLIVAAIALLTAAVAVVSTLLVRRAVLSRRTRLEKSRETDVDTSGSQAADRTAEPLVIVAAIVEPVAVESVAFAGSALEAAAEARRKALEERPVIRFLDDTAPYVPAAKGSAPIAPRAAATRLAPISASPLAGIDGGGRAALEALHRPATRAAAWAFCAIVSLGAGIVLTAGSNGAASAFAVVFPTLAGFGALGRSIALTFGTTRRSPWRRMSPG